MRLYQNVCVVAKKKKSSEREKHLSDSLRAIARGNKVRKAKNNDPRCKKEFIQIGGRKVVDKIKALKKLNASCAICFVYYGKI